MELVRIFDRAFAEVGVLMDHTFFEYSKCFREAGKATLVFPETSSAAELCVPEGFVQFGSGDMYIIREIRTDREKGEITVECEGLLSLLSGTVTEKEFTVEGRACTVLGALVRRSIGNLPAPLSIEASSEGKNVRLTCGRNTLLSDMISVCHMGDVGMKLSYKGGGLVFTPFAVGESTPRTVSRSLGGFLAKTIEWDFGAYKNVALVSGAEKDSGGRYSVTVRADSLDFPDTFPDEEYFDRQMLVKFTNPVSDYMRVGQSGEKYFDEAEYLSAMALSGAAALGRCRPRLCLYGDTEESDITPGEHLRVTDEESGIGGIAVAERVRVTYSHGTRRTVTELVSKNALGR